jgi:hypothetical protein
MGEFLKAVKSRYKLAYSVNYFTKSVKIVSFKKLKSSSNVIDISSYLESVTEIIKPQQKGISIHLKPDAQDKLYMQAVGDDKEEAFPLVKLVVGTQQDKEEQLKIGTLQEETSGNKTYVKINQNLFGSDNTAERVPYLRIFKFKGMQTVGGVTHPNSYTDELTLEDADYYEFLNTSKTIRAVAYLPVNLLSKLDLDSKITFTTENGSSMDFIIQQYAYDLIDANYIKVDFKLRDLNYNTSTARLEPGFISENNIVAGLNITATFKTIPKVDFDIYYQPTWFAPNPPPPYQFLYASSILKSTDKYGVGGESKTFDLLPATSLRQYQIRVYTGIPLHLEDSIGNKYLFTQVGSYYQINIGNWLGPFRIVF